MNKKGINKTYISEQVHGLLGIGDSLYVYDQINVKLDIYIHYNRFTDDKQLLLELTGDEAKTTFTRMTEIDDIVDNFNENDIMLAICEVSGYSIEELNSRDREEYLVISRQIIMWGMRRYLKQSWRKCGIIVSRDHSTAIHAYNKLESDVGLAKFEKEIKIQFKTKLARIVKERQKNKVC